NAAASSVVDPRDYFAGIWDTNRVGGKLYGVPWYVDTRLIFFRRDLLAQAGYAAPPRSWPEWTAMLDAIKQQRIPAHYGIVLPASEFEPLVALALQQEDPLLRDDGRLGNFESAGFTRALQFYAEMFRRGYAPPSTNADVSNVWNEIWRGFFTFYISGPWNIGEFERRLPQDLQQSWMTATLPGPNGPGASIAGGSSLVLFQKSQSKAAAWQLIEYLSQPAVQRRFHALTGDLHAHRPDSRKTPVAALARKRAMSATVGERRRRGGAAWWFVGPALVVIAVFFFLPVLAALVMSLTDFDIYALADIHNLRLVG